MIGNQLKLTTVHIYILYISISKYRSKTGIHFRDTTVGLARKTLCYPSNFLMTKMSFKSINCKHQNKDC